ncbi:MAG: hypothetical protein ISS26_00130 [Candidatus Omnitrophica bacterium]|nr:hypothetical protein [Candidatus Omnitrophota bacterium]
MYELEDMDTQKQQAQKWYYKTSVLVIAFLCVGPLALPLAWLNPTYTKLNKIVITLIMLVVAYFLWNICEDSLRAIGDYYKMFKELNY